MIHLTKLSDEEFIINSRQIERIESIPESKIILANGKHFVVKEEPDEIVRRITAYYAQVIRAGLEGVMEEHEI